MYESTKKKESEKVMRNDTHGGYDATLPNAKPPDATGGGSSGSDHKHWSSELSYGKDSHAAKAEFVRGAASADALKHDEQKKH